MDRDLVPSPLVPPSERPQVSTAAVAPAGRFAGTMAVLHVLAWAGLAGWQRATMRWDPEANARAVRRLLERMGGLWIKVGQLLSLRIDVFSVEFCRELARLQDAVPGFPAHVARRIVEQELGAPIDRIFDVFQDQPIAAASIGQVHRARLRREGAWVAVKVRRPQIEATFAAQVAIARRSARALDALGVLPFIEWRQMQWELERIFSEEVDYRVEGAAIARMRRSLRPHRMYVPEPYPQYSTTRVLVMELVGGVQMSDYIAVAGTDPGRVAAWERANDVDAARVVRRFSLSILRQILEDNLFHGDLHPGNVVLLRRSRVALLDFGTVGFTDRGFLAKFRSFMEAVTRDEFEKAADMALMLAGPLPDVASVQLARGEVAREIQAWKRRTAVASLPYQEKSVDALNVAITKVFFRHRITFDWAFLRIRRALATMDATAQHLYPTADYAGIAAAYFRLASRRHVDGRHAQKSGAGGSGVAAWAETTEQLTEAADAIAEIQRRQLGGFRRTAEHAAAAVRTAARAVTIALGGAAVAVGVGLVARPGAPQWAATLDVQVWLLALGAAVVGAAGAARVARAFAPRPRDARPRSAAFAGVDGGPAARSGRR